MVYKMAEEHGREPRWSEIEHAIRRNFGGLDEVDPVKIFKKQFPYGRNQMVRKSFNCLIFIILMLFSCVLCFIEIIQTVTKSIVGAGLQ